MKIKINLLLLIIITLNSAYSNENNTLSWSEKLLDFNVDNKWEVIYLSNNGDYKLNNKNPRGKPNGVLKEA